MIAERRPRRFQDLVASLATSLVPLILRLLIHTWSVRVVGRRVLEEIVNPGKPAIIATWHQMILPGGAVFRDRNGVIMVSRSRDGELIARVNRRMGFRNVRGSSSRGGGEALLGLIDLVRKGAQAALMVDGPRGPAHEPKMGCILAASRTGAPLIPMGCRAKPALFARNWDRTMIPLPFARVSVSLGDPLSIPPDATDEDLERYRLRLRDALLEAENRAERFLYI